MIEDSLYLGAFFDKASILMIGDTLYLGVAGCNYLFCKKIFLFYVPYNLHSCDWILPLSMELL